MKILLVEDEESISLAIQTNLVLEGYEIVVCDRGDKVIDTISQHEFDLMILDLMLPGMSGEEIIEHINSSQIDLPIIITSAKNSPTDRIKGLKGGAIDYITKPFLIEELLIRIKNITPTLEPKQDIITLNKFDINLSAFTANTNLGEVNLSKKEAALITLFWQNKQKVLTREEILSSVWGEGVEVSSRTVDNFINTLRKYFELDPKSPKLFVSVRGVGYMFMSV